MSRLGLAATAALGCALWAEPARADDCRPVTTFADFCVSDSLWVDGEWFEDSNGADIWHDDFYLRITDYDLRHENTPEDVTPEGIVAYVTEVLPDNPTNMAVRDSFTIGALAVARDVRTSTLAPDDSTYLVTMAVGIDDQRLLIQLGVPGEMNRKEVVKMSTDIIRRLRIRRGE